MLVTEKQGRLRLVTSDGRIGDPIAGVPPVDARGQGGLLDVAIDPAFADNRLVYLSYAEPGNGPDTGRNGTAVLRARLDGQRLVDQQVIFRQHPKVDSNHHFGSRLVFGRDGHLFVTLGDRYTRRDAAQTLDNHLGKIVRITPIGAIPPDNPYAAAGAPTGARPEIWSHGHRNVQGAALHPQTGELWTHEHGPQGGDELNRTERGRNHGWPVITQGREYGSGARIGEGATRDDIVPAVATWVPSIAPSGMAFLTSDRYPGWTGQLFIGALRGQGLVRLEIDGSRVVREERLLGDLDERIRDVRQGPDGWLYLLTDARDGRILRLQR
ncbi:PQQ-dependent oxidoreductase, gdhB family [Piscinibacter sakaiensis]|uniref:PQQ-dependent oxidoreductase, gdhB family n=2 Tax=Piscinibacter sakaiensis TaxID=1547922 RepID=A0A0K8P3B3_PISS1|nr:PQQ-dependent oxidoreductase, gdhB family [Piscinibacter sakaiensis]